MSARNTCVSIVVIHFSVDQVLSLPRSFGRGTLSPSLGIRQTKEDAAAETSINRCMIASTCGSKARDKGRGKDGAS